MSTDPLRLRELLERLVGAEIRFVLVGGLAVNALGYLRATQDVDLVPDPAADNLAKLNKLLRELEGKPTSVGVYSTRQIDIDGLVVRVCSLEHLLEMKRASDRPRDRDDLEALEAAQKPDGT